MTPEQMQQKSAEKVKQVQELMKLLQITCEAKERINEQGFIEKMVFWIDHEKYPQAPVEVRAPEADQPAPEEPEAEPKVEEEAAPIE